MPRHWKSKAVVQTAANQSSLSIDLQDSRYDENVDFGQQQLDSLLTSQQRHRLLFNEVEAILRYKYTDETIDS